MNGTHSIPLLGDISLEFVQRMEHALDGGFVATRIAGLRGELQQRSGRPSHRIRIAGILFGEQTADALAKLQTAAATGAELTFAADISSALDLQRVVITSFRAVELAGQPDRFSYELYLAESPPLPEPAQVESFGGLGDFGVGDLGFDTDLLGDLEGLAGEVAAAVDTALDVVDQLGALANVGSLDAGGFMEPMNQVVGNAGEIASRFKEATRGIAEVFSS
jgi:hypothetical protein